MIGFSLDADTLAIKIPGAKVDGARVISDQLQEKAYSRALEVNAPNRYAGEIEHFSASNSMLKLLTGPIDTILQYTDGRAIWPSCPILGAWEASRGSLTLIPSCMQTD